MVPGYLSVLPGGIPCGPVLLPYPQFSSTRLFRSDICPGPAIFLPAIKKITCGCLGVRVPGNPAPAVRTNNLTPDTPKIPPEKRSPYPRFFGRSHLKQVIGWCKNDLNFRPPGGRLWASKAGVFWQTGLNLVILSTRTETECFTGFSGKGPEPKRRIRARLGRIFPDRTVGVPGRVRELSPYRAQLGYAFPGSIWPRIALPATPFSGSTGTGVHAHGKVVDFALFLKTDRKLGCLNLQYSGLFSADRFPDVLVEVADAKTGSIAESLHKVSGILPTCPALASAKRAGTGNPHLRSAASSLLGLRVSSGGLPLCSGC